MPRTPSGAARDATYVPGAEERSLDVAADGIRRVATALAFAIRAPFLFMVAHVTSSVALSTSPLAFKKAMMRRLVGGTRAVMRIQMAVRACTIRLLRTASEVDVCAWSLAVAASRDGLDHARAVRVL